MHSFDTETLWQMIYAARDSEKYWRRVRRDVKDGFNLIYTYDEADGLYVEAKSFTKKLEAMAPAESW